MASKFSFVLALALAGAAFVHAEDAAEELPEETTEELIRRVARDLACYNCVASMNRFKFEVARHIKPKMTDEEKTAKFEERMKKSNPCMDKFFPERMVVASPSLFGIPKYMSYDAAWEKKGTAISKSGPEVRNDNINLCKHWVDDHKEELLQGTLEQKTRPMYEVNWYSIACFKPKTACDAEHPALDEDDESTDEQEL